MTTLAMTPAEEEAYMLAHLLGMPPPHPDIVPNFEDPYSQRYLIVLTTAITLTVSTLLVLVRTYTKRFIHKAGLGWDDCESLFLVGGVLGRVIADEYLVDLSVLAWVSRDIVVDVSDG